MAGLCSSIYVSLEVQRHEEMVLIMNRWWIPPIWLKYRFRPLCVTQLHRHKMHHRIPQLSPRGPRLPHSPHHSRRDQLRRQLRILGPTTRSRMDVRAHFILQRQSPKHHYRWIFSRCIFSLPPTSPRHRIPECLRLTDHQTHNHVVQRLRRPAQVAERRSGAIQRTPHSSLHTIHTRKTTGRNCSIAPNPNRKLVTSLEQNER